MFWFKSRNSALQITQLQWQRTGNVERVSAVVGGDTVWFESADMALTPSPEAIALVMLVPALHQRRRLKILAPLNATWLNNMQYLTGMLSSWWGYPSVMPIEGGTPALATEPTGRLAGVCFSGGIDSFFSMLCGATPIDCLIFVQGFDIRLDDDDRMRAHTATLRQVAAAVNKRLVVVRTNLREHPLFRSAPWVRTHGAALAAIGHLLTSELRQLLLASTYPYPLRIPWGSSWEIDHLWSSSQMRIVAEINANARFDKVAALGAHPLIQQHLQVCWKNRKPTGNCSACEKCLRTMFMLEAMGQLKNSHVFAPARPLDELLDAVPTHPVHAKPSWERIVNANISPKVNGAIQRLFDRTLAPRSRLPKLLQTLLKKVSVPCIPYF